MTQTPDYWSCYRDRMILVEKALLELAQKLMEQDYVVYRPEGNKLVKFIKVFKDGYSLTIGFAEVPYRWYFDADLVPTLKHGSSCNIKTFNDYNYELNVDDVDKYMRIYPFSTANLKQLDKKLYYLTRMTYESE